MRAFIIISLLILFSCKEDDFQVENETVISLSVDLTETDRAYASGQEKHYVVRSTLSEQNKLLLFIGGSFSVPQNYNLICDHAASIGLDVISLSYPNNVPAAPLGNSSDLFIFDKYRNEICFGKPLSDAVEVNSLNSIIGRTEKLLVYLRETYPEENWSKYIDAQDNLIWNKIIVAGHSQGAGHAAFLAKEHVTDRVLMFAGPNDYHAYYESAANWLKVPAETPVDKQFALLAREDELVAYYKQIVNLKALGLLSENENAVEAEGLSKPYQNEQVLSINVPALSRHNSVVGANEMLPEIWTYMLTSE